MPNLTFVLPHWLYWSILILLPLGAMLIIRRGLNKQSTTRVTSLPIAYFLWFLAGFIGMHRFYLRSFLGVVFIPVFLFILYGNVQSRTALDVASGASNAVQLAEFKLQRAEKKLSEGRSGAEELVAEARARVEQSKLTAQSARQALDSAHDRVRYTAILLLLLLIIDALLLPRLYKKCLEKERRNPELLAGGEFVCATEPGAEDPTKGVHDPFSDLVARINGFAGVFVAYWSIVAVFVYYYEVVARYVFNSPTNWAHESMFLMFGMQYLIAGGFVLRENGHVRVDVIYTHLSKRNKALVDVVTSVFFFIFTIALLWTGWIFFSDAIDVWEVSFTEWAIQYWPVKAAIPLGALLLLLQGLARLILDFRVLMNTTSSEYRSA